LIIFIAGCSKEKHSQNIQTDTNQTQTKPVKDKILSVRINGLTLKFDKNGIIYPDKKTILLFDNNNTYSKAQEIVLKKLKVKYYKTDSSVLEEKFGIQTYPTIIVLDRNKTVKYENFTPYEILKAEGF
jgi:hypothetical protein